MTASTANDRYDFRQPRQLADDVERLVSEWLAAFASLIRERWIDQLAVSTAWQSPRLETARRDDVSPNEEQAPVCCAFALDPSTDGHMWLTMPRNWALGLLAVTLGEQITELPEPRDVTDVEEAILELSMQELARVLTDSQPCSKPLLWNFAGTRQAKLFHREFSAQEPIVAAEMEVTADFGGSNVSLLLSQQAILSFMTNISDCRSTANSDREVLEQTMSEIPVEVVISLGESRVPVSDLMNLQPGDVIVLDQRVTEPLAASVGNIAKFHGWPGTTGKRQAFQISELIESNHEASG